MDAWISSIYDFVVIYSFDCVFFVAARSRRLFGSPRNPNTSRETRLIKECFHDTSDYVCLSSYYKNESEENGTVELYFLSQPVALESR